MKIIHDFEGKKFFTEIEEKICEVEYEVTDNNTIEVIRTYVDPDFRGKGIAAELLTWLSNFATENGYKVKPVCSYAVMFYKRHNEFQNLISKKEDLEGFGSCNISKKR